MIAKDTVGNLINTLGVHTIPASKAAAFISNIWSKGKDGCHLLITQ